MFRALLCSSSGGQICIIQHLVSSHSVGGRPVHRLKEDWTSPLSTCAPDGHLQVWWYQIPYNTILTFWCWAQQCSKHVEAYNKLIIKHAGFLLWNRWRKLVSAVMNLRVPWNAGNFLTSCKPVSFSRRTLHRGVSKYYKIRFCASSWLITKIRLETISFSRMTSHSFNQHHKQQQRLGY